MFIKFKKFLF